MNEKKTILRDKSFLFAIRIINLVKHIQKHKNEYVLSKQILRSGTSIGANIREAYNSESKRDFIHKLSIFQKENNETIYWLDLLKSTHYISNLEYESVKNDAYELYKIITSSIITSKKNLTKNQS